MRLASRTEKRSNNGVRESEREREGGDGSLEERRTHHCPLGGWRVVRMREKERLRRDSDTTRAGVKHLHIRLLTLVECVCVPVILSDGKCCRERGRGRECAFVSAPAMDG